MNGRRRPDTPLGDMPDPWPEPGDYWRVLHRAGGEPMVASQEPTNLTGGVWMVCTPAGSFGNLVAHTVREEADGTISVRPGDGSSNSILVYAAGEHPEWHGYIEHGVWTAC